MLLRLVEVIAVVVLAVVASRHFGYADGARITAAYLVAYLVPLTVLKRARGTSHAAHLVLLLIAIFLAWVSFDSLMRWVRLEGYSLQRPNLDGDARQYYKWALYHFDGSVEPTQVVFSGFPLMMVGLWKVLGLSVVWPQAMNQMCTLTSVVLTGMTTRRVLAGRVSRSPEGLVLGGMALMLLLPYYLMSGICILKEGVLFLSVAMAGYSLASMVTDDENRHHLWRDIALFVLACLLMTFVRTTFLYVLLLGVVVMTLPHWRRDWVLSLCLIGVIFVLLIVGNHFASYSFGRHAEIVSGGWKMQRLFTRNTEAIYKRILGYYFLYSPWHKLALLPITMSVQFILPLPWLPASADPNLLSIFCRVSYGWYLVGGVFWFYVLFMSWRRHDNIGMWVWWPVIYYMILAYIMGGTTVRYLLPVETMMMPAVVYVLCRVRERRWRRPFVWWMCCLVVIVALALLVCLELQRGVVSSFLHLPPLSHYFPSLP